MTELEEREKVHRREMDELFDQKTEELEERYRAAIDKLKEKKLQFKQQKAEFLVMLSTIIIISHKISLIR